MSNSRPQSVGTGSYGPKLSPRTIVVLFAVAVLYLLLRPTLSGWLGVQLPGLFQEDPVAVNEKSPTPSVTLPTEERTPTIVKERPAAASPMELPEATTPKTTAAVEPSKSPTISTSPPSIAASAPATPSPSARSAAPNVTLPQPQRPTDAPLATPRQPPPPRPKPTSRPQTANTPPPADANSAPLGQLTDLGGKRFRSTAGLIYVQLRSEHRIDHVLRHAKDDSSRPVHGVFNGDRDVILAVIDEAWQLVQIGRPPKVVTEDEGDRTVYIVDLGRKIGYMGGQAGKRKSFPPCKHLQLVVEGDEVVTAYPTIPR